MKLKIVATGLILVITAFFLLSGFSSDIRMKLAAEAAGSFPVQLGITKAVIVKCLTSGTPPVCTGGTLCNIKDAGSCTLYSDVSGMPAGGTGSNALFLNTAIAKAGLVAGGQLIAGGMSPVSMDSGVLASVGGCSGCVAKLEGKENFIYKILERIDNFIIAGKRSLNH